MSFKTSARLVWRLMVFSAQDRLSGLVFWQAEGTNWRDSGHGHERWMMIPWG
ncbi:MAG: hypothetical protein ISP37_08895 [Planktomarina sp.]|nr:hypothetical protein [Planktomarina sp.]